MGYLIVTLDGGGIRGLYTARLIERLQAEVPFLDKVDFFAGTSIGAINAAYLAKHRSVEGLADVFLMNGKKIFRSRDLLDRLTPDEMIRANYDQTGLRAILTDLFGKDTLADLPAKCMITTFDLDNEAVAPAIRTWKPKYGHSWDEEDAKVPLVDWLLRSSAAPTYFPSYQGFIDGGVVDNSPCASALAKAVKEGYGAGREELVRDLLTVLAAVKDPPPEVTAALQALAASRQKQISLLSLGTGLNLNRISGASHDWGIVQWMQDSRLIDMLFDGMLGPPEYVCSQVLGSHFHRLAPALTFPIDLDEVDHMDDLLAMAEAVDITATVTWLKHQLTLIPAA